MEKTNSNRGRRKNNFSEEEALLLFQRIKENRDILFFNQGLGPSGLHLRTQIWDTIAKELSATFATERSGKEIRKKWIDMKSLVKLSFRDEVRARPGAQLPKVKPLYKECILGILDCEPDEDFYSDLPESEEVEGIKLKAALTPAADEKEDILQILEVRGAVVEGEETSSENSPNTGTDTSNNPSISEYTAITQQHLTTDALLAPEENQPCPPQTNTNRQCHSTDQNSGSQCPSTETKTNLQYTPSSPDTKPHERPPTRFHKNLKRCFARPNRRRFKYLPPIADTQIKCTPAKPGTTHRHKRPTVTMGQDSSSGASSNISENCSSNYHTSAAGTRTYNVRQNSDHLMPESSTKCPGDFDPSGVSNSKIPCRIILKMPRNSVETIQEELWSRWLESEVSVNEKKKECMDIYKEVMQLKKRKLESELKILESKQ